MRAKVTLRCSYTYSGNITYQQRQETHHQAKWDLEQQHSVRAHVHARAHTHSDLGDHPKVLLCWVLFAGELCSEELMECLRQQLHRREVTGDQPLFSLSVRRYNFSRFTLWVKEALS